MRKDLVYKAITMIAIAVFLMPALGECVINGNGTGGGYCTSSTNNAKTIYNDSDCGTSGSSVTGINQSLSAAMSIEAMVEEIAASFLASNSDCQLLLNKFEMARKKGFDFYAARINLQNALEKLQLANEYFLVLIEVVEHTPYNEVFIKKLINFDYNHFLIKHNPDPRAVAQLASFLGKGDLTGLIKYKHSLLVNIESLIYEIKSRVDNGNLPDLDNLWHVSEKYAYYSLLGQYEAQIYRAM